VANIQTVSQYYAVLNRDPQLLKVFEYLVDNKKSQLDPAFDIVSGYHYPDILKALSVTAKETIAIAKRVVSLGLGTEVYHEQVIRCPFCNSEYATVRFHCPFCNSTMLAKETLIEHSSDGVIAPISSFKKGEAPLTCPTCKKPLTQEGKDYRVVGVWYGCLSCNKQFDTPKNSYLCLSCKKQFTTQELVITSVNKITIDKAILEDFSKRHFILRPLTSLISEMGFAVTSPGVVVGKSGYSHTFSLIGNDKDGRLYAFEIGTSTGPLDETAVLNMFAKVLDTKPEKSFMICMPSIVENGKKIAAVYDIKIVEGKTMEEIIKNLREMLKEQKPPPPPAPKPEEAKPAPTATQPTPTAPQPAPVAEAKPQTGPNPASPLSGIEDAKKEPQAPSGESKEAQPSQVPYATVAAQPTEENKDTQ